jgi:hypothetical protein
VALHRVVRLEVLRTARAATCSVIMFCSTGVFVKTKE